MRRKIAITAVVLVVIVMITNCIYLRPKTIYSKTEQSNNDISNDKIESIVKKYMEKGNIPGLAITVAAGDETYIRCFGYSDIKKNVLVNEKTKFELGSNSKAYTGLAILDLVAKNKVSYSDKITDYLPDVKFYYKENAYDITIEELLHHTSGIPSSTIKYITIDSSNTALKDLVKRINGIELSSKPGDKYEYSTINYDILGAIIEISSGESFEQYINENVLKKLELNDTFCITDFDYQKSDVASGYMFNWGKQKSYTTEIYRDNLPAGYIVSDIKDVLRWLQIQMGSTSDYEFDDELIQQSHEVNRSVPAVLDASYAVGWENYQNKGGVYKHGGNNQYFSSYMIFRPKEKNGVAVLCNTNSAYTEVIANEIDCVLNNEENAMSNVMDTNKTVDLSSILIVTISVVCFLIIVLSVWKRLRKKKNENCNNKISFGRIAMLVIMLIAILLGIYCFPDIMCNGLSWEFIKEWVPRSLFEVLPVGIAALLCIFVFLNIECSGIKENDNMLKPVIILSVISGIGNALVIFAINQSLSVENNQRLKLLLYALIGMILYIFGQKVVRDELINMTNQIICSQRKKLIHGWISASYEKIQELGNDKFQSAIINDTEVISNSNTIVITSITNLVTMLFCFGYLFVLNKIALLLAVAVVLFIASCYFMFGQYANKANEGARTLQNTFLRHVNDLVYGIRELLISSPKRDAFETDIGNTCEEYKQKRNKGSGIYANLFILGEMLFTLAIAFIAFCFPVIIKTIKVSDLSSYIFILLYLTGPINSLLDGIPNILNMNISWKRICEVTEILNISENRKLVEKKSNHIELCLNNVEYEYPCENDQPFKIGPVNLLLKSGEITFITGGNGSGKSTLAKIILGLYHKSAGSIKINNHEVEESKLREYCTAIFSDFHLFNRLYGIDCEAKKEEIDKYLFALNLDSKVKVVNGKFTTIDLSTGQRKRLALLVSLLEDREVYLFDEWAADQDPGYRKQFYEVILLELKSKGKCVIAITHDDRYFNIADQRIKIEYGKIV